MLNRVPYRVRLDMQERIDAMPDGVEKMILKLYCVDEIRTSEIPSCLEESGYMACSVRWVQMVIRKNFPELAQYRKPNRENEKRKGHFKYLRSHEKVACGKCGCSYRIEWHHMVPVDMGGTEDEENMVCLCKKCHSAVTNWQKRMGLIRKSEVRSDVY